MIESIPNVSEGRRSAVVAELAEAVRQVRGVRLLDHSADPSHNRSVYSLAGDAEAVVDAVMRLFEVALVHVDLRTHQGVHPRIGAVDVVPLVPLGGTTLDTCITLSHRIGQSIASAFGVPVFLYEASAARPDRQKLEVIRRGQFEGLADKMRLPAWQPDFGPARPHPTAGATVVGARQPLIAFNVNLASDNIEAAKAIAAAVRESSGGLPCVKALGLSLTHRRLAQVSMNLTDFTRTPIHVVFDAVREQAERRGERVLESELIGLIPAAALEATSADALQLAHFTPQQVLETRLASLDRAGP